MVSLRNVQHYFNNKPTTQYFVVTMAYYLGTLHHLKRFLLSITLFLKLSHSE